MSAIDHIPSARLEPLMPRLYWAGDSVGGLAVHEFVLHERLDSLYHATLTVVSDAEMICTDFLGLDASLVLTRGGVETRRVFGVMSEVEELGESDHRHFTRIEIVPAFALLDQSRNTRIFQHKSVQEIVTEVCGEALGHYGRSFDFGAVSRGTSTRDYCVQYRESDRSFVKRLCEEEGIAISFVHAPDEASERLVFTDEMNQYERIENRDGIAEFPYVDHDPEDIEVESIHSLAIGQKLTVTSTRRRDYDWRTPTSLHNEALESEDLRGYERRVYLHEDRRYIYDDIAERCADAFEAAAVEQHVIHGRGNGSTFVPGGRFLLTNSELDFDEDRLIFAVTHHYSVKSSAGANYYNEFSTIPFASTYRPQRTILKPRVYGPHTATVVGDEEIHTDNHGRIRVQFHWEERPSYAADASCWIRCAQSWAGPGWGAQFIPRRGMEVVVEFLEGDPDRPLVTGCVYNGANEYPYALPQHCTQSGWRTRSSPQSEGYNMLRFEDAVGSEEIHIHGQKDWSIVIRNDKSSDIHHDESLHIYNDRTKTVDHDEHETISNCRWITVGVSHVEAIGVNMTLAVGVNSTETVGLSKNVTVGNLMALTVGGNMNTAVAGEVSEGYAKSKIETVGKDSNQTIGANKTVDVGKVLTLKAGDKIVISCGDASLTMMKNGDIELKGKNLYFKGDSIHEN